MRAALVTGLAEMTAEPDRALMLRPMRETDRSFVLESWLRSYQTSAFAVRRGMRYMAEQRAISEWCLLHGGAAVACDETDPDVILGWCCGSAGARLDYVYVKHGARRLGVAEGLLSALQLPKGGRVTHARNARNRAEIVARGWVFEPLTADEMAGKPTAEAAQ